MRSATSCPFLAAQERREPAFVLALELGAQLHQRLERTSLALDSGPVQRREETRVRGVQVAPQPRQLAQRRHAAWRRHPLFKFRNCDFIEISIS